MRLFVDYRERGVRWVIDELFEDVVFIQLPLGDYLLAYEDGSVLVERKTARDFLSSVRSNRLWDQLLRLMKAKEVLGYVVKRRILLIHGDFERYLGIMGYNTDLLGRDPLVFWCQVMGALMEVLYVYDTPIALAENDIALKAFFKTLVRRENEGLNDKLPSARWYRRRASMELPKKDRKRYVLSSFPLIGELLAKNLLEHFHTISSIATASLKDLQKVPGIGIKRAELIYQIFH